MDDTKNKTYPTDGTAKRTAQGAFIDFLGQGVKVIEHILLVPLFLWAWGNALYGEWLTLFSLVAYFSLADIGMGNFVTNRMTQHYSKGDIKNYVRTFRSALSLYAVIVGMLFLFLIVFAFTAPFFDWFDFATADEVSVRVSILILGTYILWGIFFGLISGLYFSVGEFARYKVLTNIREVLLVGFIVLTLVFGGGFIGVASWYLALLLVFTVFVFLNARRRHPEIDFGSAKTDWKLGISFITPGLVFLFIILAEIIKLQGSVLLISSSLGAMSVAVFGVHRTLANLASRLTSTLQNALRPELTADDARGNYEKIQLIHGLLTKIALFVSVSAVVFLFFTGEGIINIWTGGRISFDPVLWIALLIGMPFYALWSTSAVFQVATNKYNQYAAVRMFSAIVGLALAFVFVRFWGVAGVIIGFVSAELLLNSWIIPKKTAKIMRKSFRSFLYAIARGLVPLLIMQALLAFLIDSSIANIWFKAVVMGVAILAVGIGFTYYVWFDEDENKIVSGLFRNYALALKR